MISRENTMPWAKEHADVLWLCLITGSIGSIAGVAALLRSSGELDRRAFWASILNSGMFSTGISAFTIWHMGSEHMLLAISLSILAGLGGNDLLVFSLGVLRLIIKGRSGIIEELKHDDE